MNTLTSYLLNVNLLLVLGYAAYYWLYRKEDNFQFNRLFLLSLALLVWLIPLFPWSTLLMKPSEVALTAPQFLETWNTIVQEEVPKLSSITSLEEATASNTVNWLSLTIPIIGMIYIAITTTLFMRFLVSLGTLFRLVRRFPREQKKDHILLHADEEISPFSFFKMIILNPKLYQQEQYELIYQHELVHARQWHNLDILIAELWCLLCWFNPLSWKMKTHIRQNLEFIADEEVLKTGVNPKVYQYCLLRLNVANHQHAQIANHFNQSLLKKRIIMMNRKKSPDNFSLKHLLLLPLLAIMVLLSWPLQSQSTTENDASSQTDHPANSLTDHPADSQTDHPGLMDEFENGPVLDGESVFGVVGADMTMETLELMKKEFAKRGVVVNASNINFTGKGKLSSIRIEMKQWNKTTVTKELNNQLGAIKGFIYLSLQHNKEEKSALISMDTELPKTQVSKARRKLLEKFTGIAVISEKGDMYMKGALDLDGEGESFFKSLKKEQK